MTKVLTQTLNTTPKFKAGPSRTWGEAQFKTALHADPARPLARTPKPADADGQLTQQAKDLVGQTFFATLLKQMHDSPFKSELFSGGKGGEAFNGLYDQTLAQRMAQKVGKKMTEPLVARYRKLAAAKAYAATHDAAHDQADPTRPEPSKESAHVAARRRA